MTRPERQEFSFLVPPEAAGRRLDRFLAARLADAGLSRSRLQGLIEQGLVSISGGRALKAGTPLTAGEEVRVTVPPPVAVELIPEPVAFTILYEDEHLAVLAKPPGLVVHPGAGHSQGTLVHGLLHRCSHLSGISGELRPGIVHRLDKDTSGCLVVAKNDAAHQALLAQFKRKEVEKIYHALVVGVIKEEEGRVDLPIGRHPVNRQKMAVAVRGGREAVTHWRVLERFSAGYTLLEVRLETGRTHQIRVHLANMGYPLAGDEVYGRRHRETERFGISRQWLHALRLAFVHPINGQRLAFTAPLWPDLAASLVLLRQTDKEEKR